MKKIVGMMLIWLVMFVMTACGNIPKAETKPDLAKDSQGTPKAETKLELAKDYLRRAEENLNEIDNIVSRQEVMESDDYAAYFIKPEADRISEQVKKVWECREKAEENLEAGEKILNEKKIDSAFYMTLEMYRDAVQGLYDALSNYSEDELSGNPPVYVYGILNAKMDCWDTFSSVEKWQKDPSAPGFSNLK